MVAMDIMVVMVMINILVVFMVIMVMRIYTGKTGLRDRQERQIWHLNLTFQVTFVGQLLQFLRCLLLSLFLKHHCSLHKDGS